MLNKKLHWHRSRSLLSKGIKVGKRHWIFLLVILGTLLSFTESQQDESHLPNIIYILADDLGYGDLSCYGQAKFSTPNIDALAANGIKFSQHYSGSTVCAPSRAVLLTGLHTGHVSVRGNREVQPEGQFPMDPSHETIPEMLKKKGYTSGAFGKWGLGFPGSESDPMAQGFDEFFGYNCQRFAHHYYPRHLWDNDEKLLIPENEGYNKVVYAPELIQEKTLDFIENHKDVPFFLYVPHVIPHAELAAPEELMEKHRGKYLPETKYEGVDDGENYRLGSYESQEECHTAFVAMVDLLDQHVGQIVDRLEKLGLMENTLIIFTSDNGPHQEGGADPEYFNSNGPFNGIKRSLTDGGIRVPMIASWKNKILPGSTSDHISSFQDVKRTIADITGITDYLDDDGISFLPSLTKSGVQAEHEYLYWEFPAQGGKIAIRYGKWKAVKRGTLISKDPKFALYNLKKSLFEDHNVADKHPNIIKKMEEIFLKEHVKSVDYPLFIDED